MGLDVGTTKVAVCVGAVQEGLVHIIGSALVPNSGLRKGIIVDIEETVSALSAALEEAERLAGVPLTSATVSVGGAHTTISTSKGVIAVSRADGEIQASDMERVLDAARAVAIPANREVLHVIPRSYSVDGQEGIKDPTGMKGIRLEVETLLITCSSAAIKNLSRSVFQAGLEVNEMVFSPLATSHLLLTKKQKEIGVVLVDIGAGTTSMIVFEEGDIVTAEVFPVGSMHITNDIAIGLRTSLETAEVIKTKYGHALAAKVRETEQIDLTKIDEREKHKAQRQFVAEIIEARLNEILGMVKDALKAAGRDGMLPAGAILTGGGSQIEGLAEMAKAALMLPVQIGTPTIQLSGMVDKLDDPQYTTAAGLMLWAMESTTVPTRRQGGLSIPKLGGVVDRAWDFLKQFRP